MLIASIVAALFLILGFWKNRRFLACVVASESMISTFVISSGLDENAVLFACVTISIYSFVAVICRKNTFIVSAYFLLIAFSLIDFAISSLYAAFQTLEFYYLAMAWYYIYWPVFVVSVGLISTGLVKNDRNGTRSTDNYKRSSHHSEHFCYELERGYARHAEKVYKRV